MAFDLAQATIDVISPFLLAFVVLLVISFAVSMFRYK